MKICNGILSLVLHASVWGTTTAFFVTAPSKASPVALRSSAAFPQNEARCSPEALSEAQGMFPEFNVMKRVEGGATLITYKIPPECDRVQYYLRTNGRPLKAQVGLWVGPLRRVHMQNIDNENGQVATFRATLKFKLGASPTLKITTKDTVELPVEVGVVVASPQRSKELDAITQKVWSTSPKTLIQGGAIEGGVGAVRVFPIPPGVKSMQILFWSKDTGKKSLKSRIEVLNGPNNAKQVYNMQCGGGSQPYHCIVQTPGDQGMIRIYNKKFVEDGLFQTVVVPYEYEEETDPTQAYVTGDVTPDNSGWWN